MLYFQSPARVPRNLWTLPIGRSIHPEAYRAIVEDFPSDIDSAAGHEHVSAPTQGDPHGFGVYTDAWGATFVNIQAAAIGEVKAPGIEAWPHAAGCVYVPHKWLTVDPDAVDHDCAATDKFVLAGCCPRPFEQLQFLRSAANLYMDFTEPRLRTPPASSSSCIRTATSRPSIPT